MKITIVGGGSAHWTPTLLVDFANSPILADIEVTLFDVVQDSLPAMVALAKHIGTTKGIGLRARAAATLEAALEGADVVITTLSVGGFASMTHDVEIPAQFGIRQPVGDSVGPGGIFRSLRSVPVMIDIARAMERTAPDALLVNVSNPLSSLCRAVTRETGIRAVGLCNELVGMVFVLSLLFDVGFDRIDPIVGGVNHLPLITELTIDGKDGFESLRDILTSPGERATEPIWMDPPDAMHWHRPAESTGWTKGDVIANCAVKFELFLRFGVLPGSADTHVSEFFPWFCTERSDFGRDWGIHHYGMAGHRFDKEADLLHVAELELAKEIPPWPSGELVATMLEGIASGNERTLAMNLPNTGQLTNLPDGAIVECMGIADGTGVRPRDTTTVKGILGEQLVRVAASQELTVDAAVEGNPTKVLEAMLCDPIAGSRAYEDVVSLTDAMLAATAPWLPQFSSSS